MSSSKSGRTRPRARTVGSSEYLVIELRHQLGLGAIERWMRDPGDPARAIPIAQRLALIQVAETFVSEAFIAAHRGYANRCRIHALFIAASLAWFDVGPACSPFTHGLLSRVYDRQRELRVRPSLAPREPGMGRSRRHVGRHPYRLERERG